MRLKNTLITIVGQERLSYLKGVVFHYCCILRMIIERRERITVSDNMQVLAEFTDSKYHIFRGYYDINYYNGEKYFLCHRLPVKADNSKNTKCEIGYYDLTTEKFTKIAESRAWCWQQGCRLRWHPTDKDKILYNDVEQSHYCTKLYNLLTKKIEKIIELPLYDVSPDGKWGISINFSRLQRLRPGYGYAYFEDSTKNDFAPLEDGIFYIDLETNHNEKIFSVLELARVVDPEIKNEHYINHISISPDSTHFIFFHIYKNKEEKGWHTVLYVSDKKGKEYRILEKEDRVSHYCWIDKDNIMITCRRDSGSEYYCIYNIHSCDKKMLEIDGLSFDGHPIKIGEDMFLTDSYPRTNGIQVIQMFQVEDYKTKCIAEIYHDYRLRGEVRCDLHPSIEKKIHSISVDTTYRGKRRGIMILSLKELV